MMLSESKVDERRKFERISVPLEAHVFLVDKKNKRLGIVRQLGRGGMMLEPVSEFKKGKKYSVFLVEDSEGIRRKLEIVVRRADARQVGCEFVDLAPDAAVELGILIGKFYSN